MIERKRKKPVSVSSPEDAYKKALRVALNVIAYRDNTEKQLRGKLAERGFDSKTVEDVVCFVKEKGYIDEDRMLLRAVHYLAGTKLYGKQRIKTELLQKQYAPHTLTGLDFSREELSDIDFTAICEKLFRKQGGVQDERTYNFLRRYGHSSSDIRAAFKNADNDNNEDT